jgi:Kdo2-lipid IVA lauroyltransferase/acyltransferase
MFSSAHIGNWEALAAYLGYAFSEDLPMVVIAKRIYYEGYNKMLVELRERFSVETIYRDEPFMQVVRHLKKGGCVGILTDQDISSIPGIFVTFFGQKTFTSDAQAKIALITGASIIPTFLVREGQHLRFIIDKPIHSDRTKDKDSEVLRITQEITSATERVIRRYPDQWAWMHRRWKTQPEDLND